MAGYPDAGAVIDRLNEAGFAGANASAAAARNLLVAIREWEAGTGFKPFVAGSDASDRTYHPPSPGVSVLDLGTGAVEIASVTVGDDTVLRAGTDYLPLPQNALADGEPYTMIRFAGYVRGPVTVSAKWGYCAEGDLLPDVSSAITARAAELCARPLLAAAADSEDGGGRIKRVKEADFETEFDLGTAAKEKRAAVDALAMEWAALLPFYRMPMVF